MGSQTTSEATAAARPSYRFLLGPRWLAFHAVMLGLVVLMVNFGFWQLDRHREVRAQNQAVAARALEPVVPVGTLTGEPPDSLEWRTVTLEGTYDETEQVLVRNRSHQGTGGLHVVTPLRLAGGGAVLVNRGWIPLQTAASPPPAPDGAVAVTARVRPSQQRGSVGPRDPAEGELREVARVDVPRIQQQTPYELAPFYVEVISQAPDPGETYPVVVPEPSLDGGPHLSYMAQWWVFSLCAVVGWGIAIRKSVRARQRVAGSDPLSAPQP